MSKPNTFSALSESERVCLAKAKMPRLVDHLLYLLDIHENNALILYSDTLSSQIPTSHAANAFNTFQRGLHQFEVVRLCALWDGIGEQKENIPTVIELIDDPGIIECLARETVGFWQEMAHQEINPSEDPAIRAVAAEVMRQSNETFGQEQAQKARDSLRNAIDATHAIVHSAQRASIMNLRHKHLAHSLSLTRSEQKVGTIAPMKYGDETQLLEASLSIVEALYCWVNGISFCFKDSQNIARANAEALWSGCIFKVTR